MSIGTSKMTVDYLNEDTAKGLLKEYSEKLAMHYERAQKVLLQLQQRKSGLRVSDWLQGSDAQFLDLWKSLRPPAVKLAQYASGTIEHARIDQATELELRLRLAEFEHYLLNLDSMAEKIKELTK